jgi:hypothetical protein
MYYEAFMSHFHNLISIPDVVVQYEQAHMLTRLLPSAVALNW